MDIDAIKYQMMKLWKDTFHDSDDYIKLIFDNYFNPDYIAYHIRDGKIISALMGVPYNFESSSYHNDGDSNQKRSLKGLYLCGLATKPEFRGSGIMTELMDEINQRAYELNFDFTFLIPANEGLIKYYYDRGYNQFCYRIKNEYFSAHDFRNEYLTMLVSDSRDNSLYSGTFINQEKSQKRFESQLNYYDNLSVFKIKNPNGAQISFIADYISKFESSQSFLMLVHSDEDVRIAIEENQISGGDILITLNQQSEMVGISFLVHDEGNNVTLQYCLFDNLAIKYRMLSEIKNVGNLKICDREELLISPTLVNHSITEDKINIDIIEKGNEAKYIENLRVERSDVSYCHNRRLASCEEKDNNPQKVTSNSPDVLEKDFVIHCLDNPMMSVGSIALWSPVYIDGDSKFDNLSYISEVEVPTSEASRENSYVMIRLLNPREILKFRPSGKYGDKNSILVEEMDCGNAVKITTNNDVYFVNCDITKQNNSKTEFLQTQNGIEITLQELSEILFRRPGGPKITSEVLSLPEIPVFIGLMLD